MNEDTKKHLRQLHATTDELAEQRLHVAGELMVLTSAVAALVQTHPDPHRFAQALRRVWLKLGQPHVGDDADPAVLHGIDAVLAILEDHAQEPLNVRPPS